MLGKIFFRVLQTWEGGKRERERGLRKVERGVERGERVCVSEVQKSVHEWFKGQTFCNDDLRKMQWSLKIVLYFYKR